MNGERFLVTGAMGCLGAWVVRLLLDSDADVTTFDLSEDDRRLRQLLSPRQLSAVDQVRGDITNFEHVKGALTDKTHVIHLAALQVPLVRAKPVLGSAVNVTGTVNVFEAVSQLGIEHLVYASSTAVYGHPSNYEERILGPDAPRLPETLYGVFKVANEDTAKVYWKESGVASIGLRPYTVFGPGRDQGVTAAPTLALQAAVAGEPYHIPYGGVAGVNYAKDVAETFVASVRTEPKGAASYSMAGDIVSMSDFVAVCHTVTGTAAITHGDDPLPFPDGLDDSPLHNRLGTVPHTPLHEAIAETAAFFSGVAA